MRTVAKWPGDVLVIGESRYRLKRVGRSEWVDDHGTPTDDAELAATFGSAIEAVMWGERHLEEPKLYVFEELWTAAG